MLCEKRRTRRRGDSIVHEIVDLTRVNHPKTADIVEFSGGYLVVPVHAMNPVKEVQTFDEAMSLIQRYLAAGE